MTMYKYPYSDFHELNLSYIMQLARESLGIHLEVVGNKLQLKNAAGDIISNVTISYATVASKDEDGHDIEAYLYDAGLSGRALVFTRGDGSTKSVALPTDAVTDKNGKDITTYLAKVEVNGNQLKITDGAGTSYSITVPWANASDTANKDANGKVITTYMADVSVVGDNLVFKDGEGVTLATITVPYAETAGEADVADKARKDINGNAFISDYGRNLIVDGNKIGIEAHDGTDLNKITVPFATLSTNATNAIQQVNISGDNIIFTTYGGQIYSVQSPFAVKAQKDDLGNTIKSTYVANVTNDPVTGEISFLDAQGHEIVSIIPTVDSAVHDSLGNDLTDYIKAIVTSPNSNYVTVTHGDGTVDSLTINYSTIAWKDTYTNPIGNTYCSLLTMGTDVDTGDPVLIGWNGEHPKAEIFRLRVHAISSYIVIDATNPDSPDTWTPTSIVGNPINAKETCVLIMEYGSNMVACHTRTYSNATMACFDAVLNLWSSDPVGSPAGHYNFGQVRYIYNSSTGKVTRLDMYQIAMNQVDNPLSVPDETYDLKSIDVIYGFDREKVVRYEAKAGAGRIIFNTNTTGVPYSWTTGSRAVTAKDEEGNTLTAAEVIAKIEAGAAIQVIATVTGRGVEGNYTPNKIQIIYDYNYQTQAATIGGICAFFMSNDNYVDFTEGRTLFINLRSTSVTGTVSKELGKKIGDLVNVDVTTAINGDVLTFNGTNWVNDAPSAGSLSSLSDVSVSTPSNGQVLTYNSTAQRWENANAGGGGGGALVVGISTTTPLNFMQPNSQEQCQIDTTIDAVYAALTAGQTVILDDGQGDVATVVGMGMSAYAGAIAVGGNAQAVRYFIINISYGNTGTITCKVIS